MSKITIDNYEAYLLDLLEGNLSGEMQVELELFLIQHPELKTDLSELPLFTIDAEAPVFKGKNSLKRSEDDLVSEAQFIAYIENQLPLHERVQLEKSCAANPSLSTELNLYKKTIATADASVVYEPKHELKRKPKVIWFNFSAAQFAAAASVVLLVGLFMLWPKSGGETLHHSNSLADNKTQNHAVPLKNTNQGSNVVKEVILPTTVTNHTNSGTGNFTNEQKLAVNSTQSNTTTIIQKTETPAPNVNTNEQPPITNVNPVIAPLKEENNNTLLASSSKTKVDVITESDDEEATETTPKKKGIWGLAKRTLKNLNTVGVKSVNGDEEQTKDNRTYALTLGNIKITHKGN